MSDGAIPAPENIPPAPTSAPFSSPYLTHYKKFPTLVLSSKNSGLTNMEIFFIIVIGNRTSYQSHFYRHWSVLYLLMHLNNIYIYIYNYIQWILKLLERENPPQIPKPHEFTPTSMAKIKKSDQQGLMKMWRNWNCRTLLARKKVVQPLWKTAWRFLKWLNLKLPNDPAILLLVYTQEKWEQMPTQILIPKCLYYQQQPKDKNNPHIPHQMNKQNVISPYNGILCCHEKEWTIDTCYNTDESWNITLSEMSQSWKTTYSIPFIWKSRMR